MKLDAFIDMALKEDVGERDHTSFACIPANSKAEGRLLVKTDGIIAGIEVAKRIFKKLDKNSTVDTLFNDFSSVVYEFWKQVRKVTNPYKSSSKFKYSRDSLIL